MSRYLQNLYCLQMPACCWIFNQLGAVRESHSLHTTSAKKADNLQKWYMCRGYSKYISSQDVLCVLQLMSYASPQPIASFFNCLQTIFNSEWIDSTDKCHIKGALQGHRQGQTLDK